MVNRKKKATTGESQVLEIAEKVLKLPYKTKAKVKAKAKAKASEPSKKLQSLLRRVPTVPIKKLQDWSDKVFDLGRLEGHEDMLIGKWVRNAMSEAGYSQRHMERVLPDTAKQDYNRYQETESDNLSDYQDTVTNSDADEESSESASTTTAEGNEEEQEQAQEDDTAELWQIKPQDYKIEELERYDARFLRELVRYLDEKIGELIEALKDRGVMINR